MRLKIAISMIEIRTIENNLAIMMQKRNNKGVEAWKDTWEFPQGTLRDYYLADFFKYKFDNETGMDLKEVRIAQGNWVSGNHLVGELKKIEPFVVTDENNDLALHFFVKADGIPKNTEHAYGHKWILIKQLETFIQNEKICPLNKVALEKMIQIAEKGEFQQYLN